MFNLSNGVSFLRAPLAFLFLSESIFIRVAAIALAMLTDCIDGYLARRSKSTSQFGAILDPAMDKFFVFFALSIFFVEGKIELWQACAMISRDFFLCLFAAYLSLSNLWENYKYKSIRWGKVSTALQFIVLIGLSVGILFPWYVYVAFICTGSLAFLELLRLRTS